MKKTVLIVTFILLFSLTTHAAVAPDFTLTSLTGKKYRLSELRGKVVILNFWATWCGACVREMPSLDALFREYKGKGLIVLGISSDRDDELVKRFLNKHPVSYPVLIDKKGDLFVEKYVVSVLPMTYIIDKNGHIVEKLEGVQDFESKEFKNKVHILLGGAK